MVAYSPDVTPEQAAEAWARAQNQPHGMTPPKAEESRVCANAQCRTDAMMKTNQVAKLEKLLDVERAHSEKQAEKIVDITTQLAAASGVSFDSRNVDTIKALQSSDLAQRKHIDILEEQVRWLLGKVDGKVDVNEAPLPQYLQREEPVAGQLFSGASPGAAVQGG